MSRATALDDLFAELGPRVAGSLRRDDYSLTLYSTDASIYQVRPYGVFIPAHADDVQAAVEAAARFGIPVLARAGGTSLAGQAVNEALVIDVTRHLDRVLEVNPEARRVRVQPGLVLDELNRQLRVHGLQFGPDPASSNRAAIGGIVANNSTGSRSICYGMTADHLLDVRAILADGSEAELGPVEAPELAARSRRAGLEGEIYRRISALTADEANRQVVRDATPRHWRRCGGYNLDRLVQEGVGFHHAPDPRFNLASLVCGSEGTLAVMTEIELKLVPIPTCTALAVLHFDRLRDALTAVPAILETSPSAVELLDHLALSRCREVPEYDRLLRGFLEGDPHCLLITEYHGESEAELRDRVERLAPHLSRSGAGASGVVPVLEPERQQDVWTVRKVGLGLLMSVRSDYKPIPFIEDAAVPVEHLADYVAQIEDFCRERGTEVTYYAHASAGCLHVRPLIDTRQASEIAKLPEIVSFSVQLLHGYGGALSSEHGDGRARSWMNERFFGPELYGLYRQVKAAFDPHGLLNPGQVVDGPSMTESLRFGADYRTEELATALDFRSDGGFDRAVEMCNGAGICRKATTGLMCPSFMVTREEEHSTRGRANLLRAALDGTLPAEEISSPRMYEAMALCVGCKGCKAECPSAVDMARIKVEFLDRYHRRHGTPLRDRLFGRAERLARIACGPWAPLVNASLRWRPLRSLLEKTLGIDRRRELPAFARLSFQRWFDRLPFSPAKPRGRVVLFVDTFSNYHDPHIAIAAHEVLSALGYEVLCSRHGCCGRTMLSKGLVETARAAAATTLDRLVTFADEGLPIVGLEPSCLLTLRDEYRALLPDDPRVERVAARAVTLEELLAKLAEAGPLPLSFTPGPRRVLLHGHCHQRALVGTGPARQALALPEGTVVEEVDSSCCGMAGSFGYEAEHYEVSQRMAERRLLPAIREADATTVIVAAGTSCRHQIADGTGRRALHPAEFLASVLAQPGGGKLHSTSQ